MDPTQDVVKRLETFGETFSQRFGQAVGPHCVALGRQVGIEEMSNRGSNLYISHLIIYFFSLFRDLTLE